MKEVIIGAIIGGVFTLIGGIIGNIIQYKIEIIKNKKENRNKLYKNIIQNILAEGTSDLTFLEEDYHKREIEIRFGIELYASQKVKDLYNNINDVNSCKFELIKLIKEELKIN